MVCYLISACLSLTLLVLLNPLVISRNRARIWSGRQSTQPLLSAWWSIYLLRRAFVSRIPLHRLSWRWTKGTQDTGEYYYRREMMDTYGPLAVSAKPSRGRTGIQLRGCFALWSTALGNSRACCNSVQGSRCVHWFLACKTS